MNPPNPAAPPRSGRHQELPAGLRDLLPRDATRFFALRRGLLDTLGRWGYRPLVPPLLEYAEVFGQAAVDPADEVSIYKMVDRDTGHVLATRSDFTPQIARIVAGRFRDASLPLRLGYEGPVLRHVPAQTGRYRELHQVGAELVGVVDPEADAEAIALMVACLGEAGAEGFKVDVGQVELFRGVLHGVDLPPDQAADVTSAVARKDLSELGRLLEDLPVDDAKKRLLAELPLLAGGAGVLDRAAVLVESDHSRAALDNLAQVVRFVDLHGLAEHLTVDLGEIRGIDYHTGVIFEAFVHHLGVPLCRGGRYDGLIGRYGVPLPATGFSVDLVALMEALRLQEAGSPGPRASGVFLINYRPDRTAAITLARVLRAAGVRAARDLIQRPLEASLGHARQQGFRWAAVLGRTGCPEGQAVVIDLIHETEATVPTDEVARHVAAEE